MLTATDSSLSSWPSWSALALGDLNYHPKGITPDAWSSYVKSHLPANFPCEMLTGNEDKLPFNALTAELPNHLGNISGPYGEEYYFEYPPISQVGKWEGGNLNPTWGVPQFTVSPTQIRMKFVGTGGRTFADGFTMSCFCQGEMSSPSN